jgi:hypothetical protein
MCHLLTVQNMYFGFFQTKLHFMNLQMNCSMSILMLLNFGSSKTTFSSYYTNLVFFKVFNQYSRKPIEVTSTICVIANKWLNWFSSWFCWIKPANSVESPQYKFSTYFGFLTVSDIQTAVF